MASAKSGDFSEEMMGKGCKKNIAHCLVCGDSASGRHYGVQSCDGCRGFFKRSVRRDLDYVCKETKACVVDVARRNQCQACRFNKCLKVKMKPEAVQNERAPRCKRIKKSSLEGEEQVHERQGISASLASLAATSSLQTSHPLSALNLPPMLHPVAAAALHYNLLAAQQRIGQQGQQDVNNNRQSKTEESDRDSSSSSAAEEQPSSTGKFAFCNEEKLHSKPAILPPVIPSMMSSRSCPIFAAQQMFMIQPPPCDNIYELCARFLFKSIHWVKGIPSFCSLPSRDQCVLLQKSWSDLFVLSVAQNGLTLNTDMLMDSNAVSHDAADRKLAAEQLKLLQSIITRVAVTLRLNANEITCMKAISLFKSECPGLQEISQVELLQDQAQLMLQECCFNQSPTSKLRFGRALLVLPLMREINAAMIERVFFCQTIGSSIEKLLAKMIQST